ncbi:MAG: hypothetical protein SGBAC_005262 [Bacillariaceae sp.]
MTLSLEAESLAKEALKAADDARKAQQRLQMLKKRYGMMKKGGSAATRSATPTKRVVETQVEEPTKTVIAPSVPIKQQLVEVHKENPHEQDSSSMDHTTVETRGTGSVTGSVTTSEKRIEDALASMGPPPPPPPPPKVIRAVSPRPAEEETRDEDVKTPEVKTASVTDLQIETEVRDQGAVNQKAEEEVVRQKQLVNEEKTLADVDQETTTSKSAPSIEIDVDQEPADAPEDEADDKGSAEAVASEWSEPQNEKTEIAEEALSAAEAPKEVKEDKPVESKPPFESSAPAVVTKPVEEAKPQVVVQAEERKEIKQEGRSKVFSFYEAQAALPVVQEGSEDSDHSREEAEVQSVDAALVQPASVEPIATQEPTKEVPQEGHPLMKVQPNQQVPQPAHHRREASEVSTESFRPQQPANMEAEAMDSMLPDPQPTAPNQQPVMRQQPVGKAMPVMAVSPPPAGRYYAAPETLHPVDELQQRVAAIPETKDDVPAPHVHENYGSGSFHQPYHYGDDVSVLTEMQYAKPGALSPRHINREPISEQPLDFQESPLSRRPINAISEETSSLYGDAPERDMRHQSRERNFRAEPPQFQSHERNFQTEPVPPRFQSQERNFQAEPSRFQSHERNFVEAETPRFRNTGISSPRGDPAGQLEPDQKDPRQPDLQDPPQINTRQVDREGGRGLEPNEIRMQPLVSHLRSRAEPDARGQRPNGVPRPNRRVQLSVDPHSPRQTEGAETVSPLSASGQSTSRFHQNRAAPLGYNTPFGGYSSGDPIVSNMPQMQHRYITTRSGAASVANYHRTNFRGDATVMSHQPMMHHGSGSPMHYNSGGSVASMPYQRTQFFHPSSGNASFHEQHYVPSGAASVAPSTGGETIISVRTNARGNKVVKKLVVVEEEDETDPVVAFCDMISIDKMCGIEFDEQYKVVEEELPPEPLTAADVGRNTAMGKKVFNENNYTDPFAGRNNETGLCGLL